MSDQGPPPVTSITSGATAVGHRGRKRNSLFFVPTSTCGEEGHNVLQNGVPTTLNCLSMAVYVQLPKSANFTLPSFVSSKLQPLMSL